MQLFFQHLFFTFLKLSVFFTKDFNIFVNRIDDSLQKCHLFGNLSYEMVIFFDVSELLKVENNYFSIFQQFFFSFFSFVRYFKKFEVLIYKCKFKSYLMIEYISEWSTAGCNKTKGNRSKSIHNTCKTLKSLLRQAILP